jgi:hypothetical protein
LGMYDGYWMICEFGKLEQVRKWMEMVQWRKEKNFKEKLNLRKTYLFITWKGRKNKINLKDFIFFNFLILFFLGSFCGGGGVFYFPSQGNDISIGWPLNKESWERNNRIKMELIKMKGLLQQKFHCFVRFFSGEKKNLEILFFSCKFF